MGCSSEQTDTVCFEKTCFTVEVVSEPEDIMKGLMFREHLDENAGMLFILPQEGRYPFWMKNTLIPLDIIWINVQKEVVFINHNTPPCEADPCPSYDPGNIALYVLELNAGKAEEILLQNGDLLVFDLS